MHPRLPTSKKWTAFPNEFQDQIKEAFIQSFGVQISENTLVIEGKIYPEEILFRAGLRPKSGLTQANFEVSCGYLVDAENIIDTIHDCVDAAASMMGEYLEYIAAPNDEDLDFPREWQEFQFNERPLYLKYTTENSDLEAKANELLGEDFDTDLVVEAADDEEDAFSKVVETIEPDENAIADFEPKSKTKH